MYEHHQFDKALDHISSWDASDLRRLVSAFIGTRYPMALALNKSDESSAEYFISQINQSLPIHGAHVGIGLCAHQEMLYVQKFIPVSGENCKIGCEKGTKPIGVWDTLASALSLREPVLVFPVLDFTTYAPLSGMTEPAIRDSSLPNSSMISCLKVSGGSAPSTWDDSHSQYNQRQYCSIALRDVIMMKPGSTIEDVFLHIKRLGALSGEFVRAEGAGNIGEKPKPQMKNAILRKHNRILKIMTNKRRSWQ